MKKNVLVVILAAGILCLSQIVSAIPAKRGKIQFTQPDGSQISILVHGDEWFHYVTDTDGNILEENASGFMVKSSATMADIQDKMTMAKKAKQNILTLQQQISKAMTSGSPKIPVILVQFKDKSFTISDPKAAFTSLLTQQGYSANGGTGSVLDYYHDQSRGSYDPQFIVMDVVTLTGNLSTYGSTDENAAKALYEACQMLNDTVDFSQFDNDHDGKIDMALLYYAGYNEAEGGPSSTIWPHQFYVPYVVTNAQAFDGVTLNRYFCTSELKGASGSNMCGIGTTCHEFAHSLGLPDFYDTNYNEYGDGEAGATYAYDVMCEGSYNNNGCTPPWMNAEELVMLNWMDGITELTGTGTVTIPSIGSSQPVAYKSPTSDSGEYFLYECRPGTGWDAPIRGGLLVYHVDKSTAHRITWKTSQSASNTQTAYNLWANHTSTNAINCNGSHPCFYVVPAGNTSSLKYSGSSFTFPGTSSITSYTPVDWSGSETGFSLSGISFNSSAQTVTFKLAKTNDLGVSGIIMDSEGNPINGVTVTISAASATAAVHGNGPMLIRDLQVLKAAGAVLQTVTTDASGAYDFSVTEAGSYILEASKSGYVTKSAIVDINKLVTKNFFLLRDGEEVPSEIYIYPDGAEWGNYGSSTVTSWDVMCANMYPASMLGAYAGKQIKSISFTVGGETNSSGATTTTGTVHAIIDFGNDRVACVEVDKTNANDWTTVDLTNEELIIPEGKDIFAGYALKSWAYGYPLTAADPGSSGLVGYLIMDHDLSSTDWEAWSHVFRIKLTIGDYIPADTGFNFIDDPKNGSYNVGDKFALSLIQTAGDRKPDASGIKWFYDDEPVSGPVTLKSAGLHTVTAKFTTTAGQQKVVELEINVK